MLSNLSRVQHALIKTEKPGLGREECPSLSFPIFNRVAHSLGLCLECVEAVCVCCEHTVGMLRAHRWWPLNTWQQRHTLGKLSKVPLCITDLSLSPKQVWEFSCKVGQKNKIWPCFHSLCLPGAFREYKTPAKKSGCFWAGSLELHISLPWMAADFFHFFFVLSPAATWDFINKQKAEGKVFYFTENMLKMTFKTFLGLFCI